MKKIKPWYAPLQRKWEVFFNIVLEPLPILLLFSTVALVFFTTKSTNPYMIAFLSTLISISGGILGGLVYERWREIHESLVLITRGTLAIRSLIILFNKIVALEQRTTLHQKRAIEKKRLDKDIINTNFEEINESLISLQENTIHSIEDWQDIIPEAKLNTLIGEISRLKKQMLTLEEQKRNITDELKNKTKSSEEERKDLEQQLRKTEIELAKTNNNLTAKKAGLENSVLSGISATSDFYRSSLGDTFDKIYCDTEGLRHLLSQSIENIPPLTSYPPSKLSPLSQEASNDGKIDS